MRIRVGTRGSPLALIQTRLVTDAIAAYAADTQAEVVIVRTEGDRNRRDSLADLGGRGVFVRDIEVRLLAGEFDLAVHSLKDLPTTQPEGLVLAAIPARGDVRDALISRGQQPLAKLPAGAVVGSSSQRRSAQVLALRPDLIVQSIRGNVETRLRKLDEGQYDAIVLAAVGLERMGLAGRITECFSMDQMLPAVGQGALAIECRADDARTRALLAPLEDVPTRATVRAERAFLRGLGGGCTLPIGAYAEPAANDSMTLRGLLAQPDGRRVVRGMLSGFTAEAETMGAQLAERLMAAGGTILMEALHAEAPPA
jgi:hydroxymethylbilane synthase